MRRISRPLAALLVLLTGTAGAQDQRPLPRGAPEAFIRPLGHVHVRVHEDLDPDRLRDLARPGVTVWLSTRSNTLRASAVENLARFDTAWVQVRAPLKPVDATVFARIPRVGAWVDLGGLDVVGRLPGARQTVVELRGPLTDASSARLQKAHAAEVHWQPDGPIDLLSWAQLSQLSGRRIVSVGTAGQTLLPVKCPDRSPREPSLELHVASLLALSSDVFPCGAGTRVVLGGEVEPWLLQSMLVRDPSVEFVLEIGDDNAKALAARKILDLLELGPSR